MTSPTTEQIVMAVVRRLHEQGIGEYTEPGEPFTTDLPGITIRSIPLQPDRLISVTCYWEDREPVLPTLGFRVQIRYRGAVDDELDADRLADSAFDLFDRQHHVVWHGVRIDRCAFISSAELGEDEDRRQHRTDNFAITTHRQEQ